MKKNKLCLLAITSALLLSACSSVSSEDYNTVMSENTDLRAKVESLTKENETLTAKNKEYLNEKAEQVKEQLSDATAIAWITTSFGDNSICLSNETGQHLQCIAGNTYSISEKGISNIWTDVLNSAKTLAIVKDSIPYESISIRFLDSSGIYILDITLNIKKDSDIMQALMCNVVYADKIIPVLQKLSK